MKYKALSVVTPAGDWIANGSKTIEVRSWSCDIQPDEDLVIVENERYLREDILEHFDTENAFIV